MCNIFVASIAEIFGISDKSSLNEEIKKAVLRVAFRCSSVEEFNDELLRNLDTIMAEKCKSAKSRPEFSEGSFLVELRKPDSGAVLAGLIEQLTTAYEEERLGEIFSS